MPKHRRNRPSRVFSLIWVLSILAVGAFATSLGSPTARAEDEPPEETPQVTIAPSPTPPGPIQCPGADSGGPLPPGSQEIVGTVTDGVDPVADLQVRLTSTAGGQVSTFTTATGEFRFQLLGDGTYFVSVYDGTATYASGFYDGGGPVVPDKADADAVILAGGGASGLTAVVEPETFGSISGVVTNADDVPVGSVLVSARGAYFPLVGCDETNAAGEYVISSLRSGVYSVVAESGSYPDAAYGSPLTVPPDATNVDMQFPPVYSLSGVVETEGGDFVPNISISACETTTSECGFGSSDGETGSFEIPGLAAGSYILRYTDTSGTSAYRTGYYGGEGVFVATAGAAVPVSVPGGPVELRAVPSPTVTGTITPLGLPEDTVLVSLCDAFEENCFADYADASGLYSVGVAVSGTYVARVFEFSGTYPSGGYIGPGGTIVVDSGDAQEIVVADANVGPIDATLPEGARIAVTEVSGGAPVQFGFVEFCRDEFACPEGLGLDEFGVGQSPVLFVGTYYVRAYSADFSTQYWYVDGDVASTDFADATAIALTAGVTEPITVEIPGAGTPTDAGEDVEPVEVQLEDESGATPVSVTFADVTASGTTSLTTSPVGEPVPSGFQLGLPATYYDISTTAAVTAPIVVCISYAGVEYLDEANLRLFHFDGSWMDITVPPVDTVNDVICGSTTSLSPFVLAERSYAFSGFIGPKAPPKLNDVRAGDTIGLVFSLGGNFGLDIFATGSPVIQRIDCVTGAAIGDPDATTASHKYSARQDRYTFSFSTAKAWKNTCRSVTLTFKDGTSATVWYRFKA